MTLQVTPVNTGGLVSDWMDDKLPPVQSTPVVPESEQGGPVSDWMDDQLPPVQSTPVVPESDWMEDVLEAQSMVSTYEKGIPSAQISHIMTHYQSPSTGARGNVVRNTSRTIGDTPHLQV